MGKRSKGSLYRLILAAGLCSFFLGMTLTTGTEETDGCGGGHDSGILIISNMSTYYAHINLGGPIVTQEHVGPGKSIGIHIRAGFYHWVALFSYGPFPATGEGVDSGVVTVEKDEETTITIKSGKS